MIRLKQGVRLEGLVPQMLVALRVVEEALLDLNGEDYDCWITSGNDGVHMDGSLHYRGRALDFRTKHLPGDPKIKQLFANRVREALGDEFDVVLEDPNGENQHVHVELDVSW